MLAHSVAKANTKQFQEYPTNMKTILDNPFFRYLAVTLICFSLLMVTGCSGCSDKEDSKTAKKKAEEGYSSRLFPQAKNARRNRRGKSEPDCRSDE